MSDCDTTEPGHRHESERQVQNLAGPEAHWHIAISCKDPRLRDGDVRIVADLGDEERVTANQTNQGKPQGNVRRPGIEAMGGILLDNRVRV